MKGISQFTFVLAILLSLVLGGAGCVPLPAQPIAPVQSPAALAGATARPMAEGASPSPQPRVTWSPTATSVPPTSTPTATPVPPTPTATATATRLRPASPTPTRTPTPDRKHFVITEQEINAAIAQGMADQAGLMAEGLTVRFADGKVWVNATRLTYGMIRVQNLAVVVRPVAQDGKVVLEFQSISPRGLITSMIPALANQALQQYAGAWYVTEVRVGEGYLEIWVR